MKRRCVAVALVSAVALISGGCLNFVEPEPGPGQLEAFLRLSEGDEPRTEFDARFSPGATEGGDVRAVAIPTIRILGASVSPSPESSPTQLIYRLAFGPGSDAYDRSSVELVGPRLREDAPRAHLTAPLIARAGPDSIGLADDEALKLPLHGAQHVRGAELAELRWSLVVREKQGATQVFSSHGTGSLPDTLEVQQQVLADVSGPLEASLVAVLEAQEPPDPAGYGISLRLNVRLQWTITRS